MIDARFVPIAQWPGKQRNPRPSDFSAKYGDTLNLLERELRAIGAKKIIIQAYFRENQIRNDGWPYSSVNPSRPGVILTFESKKGTLNLPCDTFMVWHDNLRAIALSLEALRKVDRYGVTQNNEQYKGWAQLEAPAAGGMSNEAAARFVEARCGIGWPAILSDANIYRDAYKAAAMNCHPDRGGTHDLFVTLQQAKEILDRHHGITSQGARQ